jgi:hypothetical protein
VGTHDKVAVVDMCNGQSCFANMHVYRVCAMNGAIMAARYNPRCCCVTLHGMYGGMQLCSVYRKCT